jgi:predicted thioesterase
VNPDAAARAYFDEHRVVPANTAPAFAEDGWRAATDRAGVSGMSDAAPNAWLLATLQAAATRELARFLDDASETPVAVHVECRYWAPLTCGAELRLVGWIDAIEARFATFRVQAHDAQGLVCEARIETRVVSPSTLACEIGRKRDALARRRLFEAPSAGA